MKTYPLTQDQVKAYQEDRLSQLRLPNITRLSNHKRIKKIICLGDYWVMVFDTGKRLATYQPFQPSEEIALLEDWRVEERNIDYDTVLFLIYRDGREVCLLDLFQEMLGQGYPQYVEDLIFTKKDKVLVTYWQPAKTMPCEFSRFKAKVTQVRPQQLGDHFIRDLKKEMGMFSSMGLFDSMWYKGFWNTLHPNHPYDPKIWTWVIEIKPLAVAK